MFEDSQVYVEDGELVFKLEPRGSNSGDSSSETGGTSGGDSGTTGDGTNGGSGGGCNCNN
jgi:uncharacterized membrane protein YgcG